jgi:hypothetical protein
VSIAPAEPVSPELALVSPELRTLAIAALWRSENDALRLSSEIVEPGPARTTRLRVAAQLSARLVLYALWQLLVGALLGLAAFVAFGVALFGVDVLRH